MSTPKPPKPGTSAAANLFDQIELTPEEEQMLDDLWASPEMQAAIAAAASASSDDAGDGDAS